MQIGEIYKLLTNMHTFNSQHLQTNIMLVSVHSCDQKEQSAKQLFFNNKITSLIDYD